MPRRADRSVGGRILLNGGSGTPIYIQLADQLKYLIGTGELGAGSRLPAARHLASNLQINRNTVLNAYSVLAEEGYVEARRGAGTIICARPEDDRSPGNNHFRPDFLALVDQLVDRAAHQGLTPEQTAAVVASHARMKVTKALLRVCFVECNPHSLEHYVGQIRREFDVVVIPVLLREIAAAAARGDFAEADCVVSTFFHLSEVRRTLRDLGLGPELFAIAVRPHVSTLRKLERLAPGSTIGVAYVGEDDFSAERLRRMTEAVEHVGLREVRVQPFLLNEAPDPSMFAGLDALLVRPENIAAVRSAIPSGLTIVEFLNEMDAASREFLREVFRDLRARRSGAQTPADKGNGAKVSPSDSPSPARR